MRGSMLKTTLQICQIWGQMVDQIETLTQGRELRKVPVSLSRNARTRGQHIAQAVCAWVRRWGYTGDKVLSALYPGRPKLGYDLWRRGLLVRYQVPAGIRLLDGRYAYGLSADGAILAEQVLPAEVLDIEHSAKPAWSTMQHLFDVQRYAITLGMLPDNPAWRTEPELRTVVSGSLVPDLRKRDGDKLWWIEADRSAKKDVALDFWTQQITHYQARSLNQRDPDSLGRYVAEPEQRQPLIERLIIVVGTDYQAERYRRAFAREVAEPLTRDPKTRQIRHLRDRPNLPMGKILGTVNVEIYTPETLRRAIAAHDPEKQRSRMLLSALGCSNVLGD